MSPIIPAAFTLALGALACLPGTATASHAVTQDRACTRLKWVISKLERIPESGPVGLGWYCEFATPVGTSYVIALPSNRKCDGICSDLMGWYAVDWRNGAVHDFDVANMEVGALVGQDSKP